MSEAPPEEVAASRSRTFWLLSECYLEPPAGAFLENLRGRLGAFSREAGDELPPAWAALRAGFEADGAEALAVEHTRLFAGLHPGHGLAPPYESVHREGQPLGDVTLAVVRSYANAGFGTIHAAAGPQDHLGVELRFVSLAAHGEMDAWMRGDCTAATGALERQRDFLEAHLLAWAPGYCRALSAEARTAFHRALGDLTERVLADDQALLNELLADLAA